MIKRGKRHFTMDTNGKWFAHPDGSESESRFRETCTTTGAMLSEAETVLPKDLHAERYPKWKVHQQSREYPLSCHDNKRALKSNISVFSNGVGRRKYPDELRQNKSPFLPSHNPAENCNEEPRGSFSTYQTDFISGEVNNVPNRTRRFPRNHKLKSAEAFVELAGKPFMWFGQDKSSVAVSLEVLAAAKRSAPSKT